MHLGGLTGGIFPRIYIMTKISNEKFALRVLDFFKIKHTGVLTPELIEILARKLSVKLEANLGKNLKKLREAFVTYKIVNRKTLQKRPVDTHKPDILTTFTEGKSFRQPTITQAPPIPQTIVQKPVQLQGTVNNPLDQFLQDLDKFSTPSQARVIKERIARQQEKAQEITDLHGGQPPIARPRKTRAKKPKPEEEIMEPDSGSDIPELPDIEFDE